jgi:transposase-like protein
MPDVDPALCPRCNSRNTEQMTSKNKLGLTIHRCKACDAQFTVQRNDRAVRGIPRRMSTSWALYRPYIPG